MQARLFTTAGELVEEITLPPDTEPAIINIRWIHDGSQRSFMRNRAYQTKDWWSYREFSSYTVPEGTMEGNSESCTNRQKRR